MCKVVLNEEKNGIELSFENKPDRATLDSIKAQGFRWHNAKKVWYAKQTDDRLTFAKSLGSLSTTPKSEGIDLDNLGATSLKSYYHTEVAAAIREDLKKRGVKGATVRGSRGYGITVTVKATNDDIVSIEEYCLRYTMGDFAHDVMRYGAYDGEKWIHEGAWCGLSDDEKQTAYMNNARYSISKNPDINVHYMERKNYPTMTTAFYNKIEAIYKIANQWNYDNSDYMTDYFDVGYYLDIDVKLPADFSIRETMTDDEKKAYADELEAKRLKEEAERKAYEEEQRRREEEYQRYKAWEVVAVQSVNDNAVVEDLPEDKQIFIDGLTGGIGKENTIDELIDSLSATRQTQEAVITRIVSFTDQSAYDNFCHLFLNDFEWLRGMGGTATEDVRMDNVEWHKLNTAQRESLKIFMRDCIAVKYLDEIRLVINPEGHSYARYVYLLSEESEIKSAADVLGEYRKESEGLPPFYFPEDVVEQSKALEKGMKITVYQCDGWILNSIYGGSGRVIDFYPGTWAQYDGLYIELEDGKKTKKVFIRNNHECLVYEGIMPLLPDEVTRIQISDKMFEIFNYDQLFPNTYNYYKSQGIEPIIDTWQR